MPILAPMFPEKPACQIILMPPRGDQDDCRARLEAGIGHGAIPLVQRSADRLAVCLFVVLQGIVDHE